MNHKKWREKFWNKDSRRYLKTHDPFYSSKYHQGVMPPTVEWLGKTRKAAENYRNNARSAAELHDRTMRGSAETNAMYALMSDAPKRVEAFDIAVAEVKTMPNGKDIAAWAEHRYREGNQPNKARRLCRVGKEKAEYMDFIFLRSYAYALGFRKPVPVLMPRTLKKHHDNFKRHHSRRK